MIIIQGIQSCDAHKWWSVVEDWCRRALDRGGALLWFEDLVEGVAAKDMQMWVVFEAGTPIAVAISQVEQWKRGKALSAFIIGGEDMHKWLAQLDDVLTRYARSLGCDFITGEGRKGWERSLKPLGWQAPSVTYMKRI